MKRSIISLAAVLAFVAVKAQQIPLYTQYYNNEFLYNPSQTLTDETSSLDLFYRKQWVLLESSLVTQGFVFQTPIKAKKIGLGVNLINDKFGIFNRTGAAMAYSYQVDLNDDHKLLLGLSAGFMNTNYDWNQDLSLLADPRLVEAITDRVTSLDATFGFTYKWKALELGMAVPHLLEDDLDFTVSSDDLLYFNYRHYVGNLSYQFNFNKVSLRPLVLVRYQPSVNPQIDASLVARYDEKFWAAFGYRHEGALTFGGGVNLHQRLRIGYSYDMNLNTDLNQYFGATHEITLGIRFGAVSKQEIIPPPEKDTTGGGVSTPSPSLEDLQKQIDKLKREQISQDSTLDDHERRIRDLENQINQDSIQRTIEEILMNERIGSGSVDYRGDRMILGPGSRKVVNPTGPGRFGFDEDGNAIGSNSDYSGPVFYDKEGTRRVVDPQNPDVELYDKDGNRIEDLSTHSGIVKDKTGKVVRGGEGNPIVYQSNIDKEGVDETVNIPLIEKPALVGDGIRYTAPGNYVVVGSFRNKEYAIQLREKLQDRGYSAGIVYNHYRKWFYVYALETDDFSQAVDQLRKEQAGSFSDAWLHVIIE